MVQFNQKWYKVLELFFEFPNKDFTVREISKKTKIPATSVQRYLKEMKKKDLISKNNVANITPYFKFLKTFLIINKMHEVGLIDYLKKELNPGLIILFGSARKGEYDRESDIDLFVETSIDKKLELKDFEKNLNHSIQIFRKNSIHEFETSLFNNVVNGIKLYGSFKAKQ